MPFTMYYSHVAEIKAEQIKNKYHACVYEHFGNLDEFTYDPMAVVHTSCTHDLLLYAQGCTTNGNNEHKL